MPRLLLPLLSHAAIPAVVNAVVASSPTAPIEILKPIISPSVAYPERLEEVK